MARANRCLLAGQISHLTHRCHNRAFLLRFARARDAYLYWLREGLRRFDVTLLGYCVTCNHGHLLVHASTTEAVSELMRLLEGQVGAQYNRRKGVNGAFWADHFHAPMIDSGEYFWNCLSYVDLNMVRARVVDEPGGWRWGQLRGTDGSWGSPKVGRLGSRGGVDRLPFGGGVRAALAGPDSPMSGGRALPDR